MSREAARLTFPEAKERVGLVDGASWISPQFDAAKLKLDGLELDFYHLSQNVHRCRRNVFGEKSPAGTLWAKSLLHTFRHDGYEPARTGAGRLPVDRQAETCYTLNA